MLGSVILGLMFLRNATQRSGEVGILRAIGVTRNQILGLFLGKSLLIGFIGGGIGLTAGGLGAMTLANMLDSFMTPAFDPRLIALVPLAAALLSVLATWIPIEAVTGKDPASLLREAS